MKFSIQPDVSGECQIVGIFEDGMTPTAKKLNKASHGYIAQLLEQGDFEGKIGQSLMLYQVPHLSCERLLLVGCGKEAVLTAGDFRKIICSSIKAVSASKTTDATLCLTELTVATHDLAWKIQQIALMCHDTLYQFEDYKSDKKPKTALQHIALPIDNVSHKKACEKALSQGIAIAAGMDFTKNLANQPSNVCTPSYLAEQSKKLQKQYKSIKTTVLEESDMKKLGMNALLAVSQGSQQDAKFVCIEYKGTAKKQAPIVLVGKGITFDTGGISLKSADGMNGMKYDMCGAATVLGTLKAAAEAKLPIHLIGILAAAENMPSGTAVKPEDIVTSLSGQTIEIMNTDAEGRLVLCDALTYCERFKPDTVIDIATLTGAVVVALGLHASGLLSNHEPLAKELLAAGTKIHDRAWQLPLWDEYQEQLKSPFADMSNVGGKGAGTITAACFLSRFAKKFHWAHLDVAGTAAIMGGGERMATGRPVPMLMQFLIDRSHK